MVIKSYQTLYVNCLGYGMRKYMLVDEEKSTMQERIENLEKECQDIEENVRKAEEENINLQKKYEDDKGTADKDHNEFVQLEKEKLNQLQNDAFKILQLKLEKEKQAEKPKEKDKDKK